MMYRRWAIRLPLLLTLVLLISCSQWEEYQPEPVIYAVLSSDPRFSYFPVSVVKVGLTLSVGDTVPVEFDTSSDSLTLGWNGVTGAQVSLSSHNGSYQLEEDTIQEGIYLFDPDSVAACSSGQWVLDVTYPDGNRILAQTAFPGDFDITYPEWDSLYYRDSICWEQAEGAAGYAIWVDRWFEDDPVITTYMGLMDNHYLQILIVNDLYFPEKPDSIQVWIAALDSNFYNYYQLEGKKDVSIPGAWGVFGSMTVISHIFSVYWWLQ